jgi:anti-anti-sigma factor
MSQFATRTFARNDHTVVAFRGELDAHHVPELGEILRPLARAGAPTVLDLTDVGFCGSAALELFIEVRNTAQERGGSLTLTGVPRTMRRLLDVTHLGDLFPQDIPTGTAV